MPRVFRCQAEIAALGFSFPLLVANLFRGVVRAGFGALIV